jgi:hypothetical protein
MLSGHRTRQISENLIVLAKEEWKTMSMGTSRTKDTSQSGMVEFKVMKLAGNNLSQIAVMNLEVWPSLTASGSDYLTAITGSRLCVVYSKRPGEQLFEVLEINEQNKQILLKGSLAIEKTLRASSIIAISDQVFLGFNGQVGVVNLSETKLTLNLFHNWHEMVDKVDANKAVDIFAYDSVTAAKTLVAIDDFVWPKYGFTYDLSKHPPKNTGYFDLPAGTNEHYHSAAKHGETLVILASFFHHDGKGNRIVVMHGSEVKHSIYENATWQSHATGLFDEIYTNFSAIGLLNNNIMIVSAGERGVIAIPMESLGVTRDLDCKKLENVKRLQIGQSAQHLVTAKDKSYALVVAAENNNSTTLAQLKWSSEKNDFEVAQSHRIAGNYHRLFIED